MKKNILVILVILFTYLNLYSYTVDENEVKPSEKTVEFINYRGKYRYTESIFEIRSIGTKLDSVYLNFPL
ncbi:MAG TPA: hypothetical protein PLO89_04515 [Spirochaetota bacterium]|nr:hypothetical protein [Spirochaetota bacterium]